MGRGLRDAVWSDRSVLTRNAHSLTGATARSDGRQNRPTKVSEEKMAGTKLRMGVCAIWPTRTDEGGQMSNDMQKAKFADMVAEAVAIGSLMGLTRLDMSQIMDGVLETLPPENFVIHISDSYDTSAADEVPGISFTDEKEAREWCEREWSDTMTGAALMNLGPIKWNGRIGVGPYKLQMSEHSGWYKEEVTYTIIPK